MKAGKVWGQTELLEANGVLEFHRIEAKAGGVCSKHKHKFKWNGFFVAKGTPTNAIERLAKTINEATKDPVVKARMGSMGIEPVGNTPEQFTTFLQGEIKQWRALVQSNNIRAD